MDLSNFGTGRISADKNITCSSVRIIPPSRQRKHAKNTQHQNQNERKHKQNKTQSSIA